MRDEAESEDEVTMNMNYYTTTHALVLPTETPKDFPKFCLNKDVTHVVSSIVYGMNANFIFKRMKKEGETTQIVVGALTVAVNLVVVSIEGRASLNITTVDKDFQESINVKLYGDFILEEQPTTYMQAVKAFQIIPKKLGSPPLYGTAAPVKMTLTPRSYFCDSSDNLLLGISAQLLEAIGEMMNRADKLKVKLRGLLNQEPSQRFVPVRRNLQSIQNELQASINDMQMELQRILPEVRGGGANGGEVDLIALMNKNEASPLQYDKLVMFLGKRTREIIAIQTLLKQFTGNSHILVVDYEQATGVIEMLTTPQVVIFNLNILQPHSVTLDYLDGKTVDESNMWFNKPDIIGEFGRQLREFKDFAAQNGASKQYSYLVRINPVTSGKTMSIEAMQNGHVVSSDFLLPVQPPKPIVTNIGYD